MPHVALTRLALRSATHPLHAQRAGRGLGGLVVAVAVIGAVGFFGVRTALEEGPPEPTLAERYAADPRIRLLLEPCGHGKPFEGDTSAMIEVLVAKLGVGAQLEPLRRAKQELAKIGAPAEPALRRLYDESSREQFLTPVALNVLEVCGIADDDFGLAIAREGLVSPREDLRAKASYVFRKHGRPEDYDLVKASLLASSSPELGQKFALAMKACDPGRFHYEVVDLIDALRENEGGLAVGELADVLAAECADAVDPVLVDQLYTRAAGLAPRHRAYMIAPAAALADSPHHAAALDELRALLKDPLPAPRQNACNALARAGLVAEVLPALTLDESPGVRSVVTNLVAEAVRSGKLAAEDARPHLRSGLADPDVAVMSGSLAALLQMGDEVAWAEALRRLEGSLPDRDLAVRALGDAWPGLGAAAADQARSRLVRIFERRAGEGAASAELTSVLKALGSVPGRATAEFLLDVGVRLAGQQVSGIDGHWWCVGQAYNAGPEAQAVIRERLAGETDPFRRLDLIAFLWQDPHPDAVEVMLGVLTDPSRDPHERLYVAERLLNMGATQRVAPTLKQVYWESTDPVLKPGLQCLLWIWYGVAS